jgi:hypothetical protein
MGPWYQKTAQIRHNLGEAHAEQTLLRTRAQSETFHPRLEDARSSCPDSEPRWPYVEDEQFALLFAYFESIRKRFTEPVEERTARLEEMESILRAADEII